MSGGTPSGDFVKIWFNFFGGVSCLGENTRSDFVIGGGKKLKRGFLVFFIFLVRRGRVGDLHQCIGRFKLTLIAKGVEYEAVGNGHVGVHHPILVNIVVEREHTHGKFMRQEEGAHFIIQVKGTAYHIWTASIVIGLLDHELEALTTIPRQKQETGVRATSHVELGHVELVSRRDDKTLHRAHHLALIGGDGEDDLEAR
jgi:hypothetical protein